MQSIHKIEIDAEIKIRVYFWKDNRLDCIEGDAKIVWMDSHREKNWVGYRHGVYFTQMPVDYNVFYF